MQQPQSKKKVLKPFHAHPAGVGKLLRGQALTNKMVRVGIIAALD